MADQADQPADFVTLVEAALRSDLWQVKVDPHGHPGQPGRPVPEEECPVCRIVNRALNDGSQEGRTDDQ